MSNLYPKTKTASERELEKPFLPALGGEPAPLKRAGQKLYRKRETNLLKYPNSAQISRSKSRWELILTPLKSKPAAFHSTVDF
jgi:hypothetical protein